MRIVKWNLLYPSFLTVTVIIIFLWAIRRRSPCMSPEEYLREPGMDAILDYCNGDVYVESGQEGEASLELLAVNIFIRHGDRYRIHGIDNYDSPYMSCKFKREFKEQNPIIEHYDEDLNKIHKNSKIMKLIDSYQGAYPNKDACEPTDLTPEGALQHVKNGVLLKQKYSKFLSSLKIDDFKFYATEWPRTFQSAVAFLYGFLGNDLRQDLFNLPFQQAKDYGFCTEASPLSCDCPSVQPFVDQMAVNFRMSSPASKSRLASAVFQHYANTFNLLVSNVPKMSRLFDFTATHVCHHLTLPGRVIKGDDVQQQCVQPYMVAALFDLLQKHGEHVVKQPTNQKVTRLKMAPVLHEILQRTDKLAAGEHQPKFILYSGHDTTIDNLGIALNFSSGRWPPYASRIVLEFYRQRGSTTKNELFVRILYNGNDVTRQTSFCREVTKSSLCPYSQFKQYVTLDLFRQVGATNYQNGCSTFIS